MKNKKRCQATGRSVFPIAAIPILLISRGAIGLEAKAAVKPNIILAMADDMGWRDPSCFGNDRVATPNVDRLAKEGMRLTRYYAASVVCTPTRASVLTGKYPLRFNIRKHFTDRGEFLPVCVTLPKLLKKAGYQTPNETTDLMRRRPDVVGELERRLTQWLAEPRRPFGRVE